MHISRAIVQLHSMTQHVHNDIRWPNIVRSNKDGHYLLIDFENVIKHSNCTKPCKHQKNCKKIDFLSAAMLFEPDKFQNQFEIEIFNQEDLQEISNIFFKMKINQIEHTLEMKFQDLRI